MSLPNHACPVADPSRGPLTLQPPDAATLATSGQATAVPRLSVGAEGSAVHSLDLGQKTGWAMPNGEGAIASGTTEFEPDRFEGRGKADALALLHRALAQGGRR